MTIGDFIGAQMVAAILVPGSQVSGATVNTGGFGYSRLVNPYCSSRLCGSPAQHRRFKPSPFPALRSRRTALDCAGNGRRGRCLERRREHRRHPRRQRFSGSGPAIGAPDGVSDGSTFALSILDSTGANPLLLPFPAVPEPASILLLGAAMLTVAARLRRVS